LLLIKKLLIKKLGVLYIKKSQFLVSSNVFVVYIYILWFYNLLPGIVPL